MVRVPREVGLFVDVAGVQAVVVVLCEGCVEAIAIVRRHVAGVRGWRERAKQRGRDWEDAGEGAAARMKHREGAGKVAQGRDDGSGRQEQKLNTV